MILDVETNGLCEVDKQQGKKKKKYFRYQHLNNYENSRVVQLSYSIVKFRKNT